MQITDQARGHYWKDVLCFMHCLVWDMYCLMVLLISSEMPFNTVETQVPSFHCLDLITSHMTVTAQRMKLKTSQFVLLRIGVTILFFRQCVPITTSKKKSLHEQTRITLGQIKRPCDLPGQREQKYWSIVKTGGLE